MARDWLAPAITSLSSQFGGIEPTPRIPTPMGTQEFAPPGIQVQDRGAMAPPITFNPDLNWNPTMGNPNPYPGQGVTRVAFASGKAEPDPFVSDWGGGGLSEAGGDWATLDGMNAGIAKAAAENGVPANLIKAMLAREGAYGTDFNVVGLRGERVFAFNGIFESTAISYGIDFNKMTTDTDYAIWAMGKVLSSIKTNNSFSTWDDVAGFYFAGPNYLNYKEDPSQDWGDEVGNTISDYMNGPTGVVTHWKELDALGGGGGGWSGDWSFIDNGTVADWGEYGHESTNGYYKYGRDYGLNGTQHTGVDISGPWNSAYRSPVSGTVTCAGTGNGAGADGGGCAAFETMDSKGGAGRIEVTLDNGTVLIFGHSQGSFVQPGQRINVGDALGTIGWANSAHIHLEARVPDSSMPSGYRIVDPREVLGGGGWGGDSGGGDWSGGNADLERFGPDMAGYGRWR